jgi:hypothetical protein
MLRLALATGAAFLLVSGDTPRQDRAKVKFTSDLELIQGIWVLKTTECCGLKADQDPTEDETYCRREIEQRRLAEQRELPTHAFDERTILEIKDTAFVFRNGVAVSTNGGCIRTTESTEGTITLNSSPEPRVMTKRLTQPAIVDGDETVYASYSVKGNTLRLGIELLNDPMKLPTTFVTDKDKNVVVLTFKRGKK